MTADQMRQALRDRASGVFTDEELDNMTPEQLRVALENCRAEYTADQIEKMTADQMRDALLHGGHFTEEQLKDMTPEQLREAMKKKMGRISKDQLDKMTADQMRQALRDRAPGMFTDEDLDNMTPEQLRVALEKRGAGKDGYFYFEEDLKRMSPAQLREAMRKMAPGKFSEEQIRKMTPDQLRDELRRRRKAAATKAASEKEAADKVSAKKAAAKKAAAEKAAAAKNAAPEKVDAKKAAANKAAAAKAAAAKKVAAKKAAAKKAAAAENAAEKKVAAKKAAAKKAAAEKAAAKKKTAEKVAARKLAAKKAAAKVSKDASEKKDAAEKAAAAKAVAEAMTTTTKAPVTTTPAAVAPRCSRECELKAKDHGWKVVCPSKARNCGACEQCVKRRTVVCPRGWFSHFGKCYVVHSTKYDYSTARAWCQAHGAELVSINSERENKFVLRICGTGTQSPLLQPQLFKRDSCWLGLTEARGSGSKDTAQAKQKWDWADGRTTASYSRWRSSPDGSEYDEPNNGKVVPHIPAVVDERHATYYSGKWYDRPASFKALPACQMRATIAGGVAGQYHHAKKIQALPSVAVVNGMQGSLRGRLSRVVMK